MKGRIKVAFELAPDELKDLLENGPILDRKEITDEELARLAKADIVNGAAFLEPDLLAAAGGQIVRAIKDVRRVIPNEDIDNRPASGERTFEIVRKASPRDL